MSVARGINEIKILIRTSQIVDFEKFEKLKKFVNLFNQILKFNLCLTLFCPAKLPSKNFQSIFHEFFIDRRLD